MDVVVITAPSRRMGGQGRKEEKGKEGNTAAEPMKLMVFFRFTNFDYNVTDFIMEKYKLMIVPIYSVNKETEIKTPRKLIKIIIIL